MIEAKAIAVDHGRHFCSYEVGNPSTLRKQDCPLDSNVVQDRERLSRHFELAGAANWTPAEQGLFFDDKTQDDTPCQSSKC